MSIGVTQWGRECRVQVGTVVVRATSDQDSLRVAFVVERELGEVPPRAEIQIYGLSEATRNKLEETPNLTCSIDAGYTGHISSLFTGVMRRTESIKQGTDWVFRASVGDPVQITEESKKKAKATFQKETPNITILSQLIKLAGLKAGNSGKLSGSSSELKFSSGADRIEKALSIYGSPLEELGYFCRSIGIIWSIEDGAFKGAIAGTPYGPGPLLNSHTGLIEQPRINDQGHVLGYALLLPELRPGIGFTVESRRVSGQFIAVQTKHSGDTHATNDWQVEFRGVPPGGFGSLVSKRYQAGNNL